MSAPAGKLRAWVTLACGIESFTAATSRSRAIASTFRAARDAGFQIAWTEIRAWREPNLDAFADQLRGATFARDYLPTGASPYAQRR